MLRRLLRSVFAGGRAARSNERGLALAQSGNFGGAESAFREALALNGRYAAACSNLGRVLIEQRRYDEALATLRRAVELDPRHAGARVNLANALHRGGLMDEALEHYREAVRIDPASAEARANLLKPLLDVCAWDEAQAEVDRLLGLWRSGASGWESHITPFVSLLLPVPPEFQLHVARHHSRALQSAVRVVPRSRPAPHARLRIAYVSCDFRDHATAHLCAGLFQHHDRRRVEVFAYSFGDDDGSEWRSRIVAGCDHFVDIGAEAFAQTAARIARDEVDILVDLKGYTGDSRPEIFAMRPAPVQVGYLGYPGTMGAAFIDYLVADRTVAPPGSEAHFSEALAWLPHCYQVNDVIEAAGSEAPARAAAELPPGGVVFCCFNQLYKIEAGVFSAWMRILGAVPGSVLWLIEGPYAAMERLRARAAAQGVAPERLIFAPRMPKFRHIARHRVADLFLDTFCCNAHTTASDALRAGVPMVSLPGGTFASRVGASLLRTAGLPDLVARDPGEYERLAIDLARAPARLASVKARLAENGSRGPLFDPAGFARNLDDLFEAMWRRHAANEPPGQIAAG